MRFVLRIEWKTDFPDELEYIETYPLRRLLPHEIELMQFTGLLDKNGKEIYEGDILRGKCDPGEEVVVHVKYKSPSFALIGIKPKVSWSIAWSTPWEVIGNIHENPELLK